MVTDEHGQPTVPGQPKSSGETLLHCVVASVPDLKSEPSTHALGLVDRAVGHFFKEKGFEIEGFECLRA